MKVMLVYPNDRMDNLIPIGLSVLSAHLKAAGHDVQLYDTTFYDVGKETGDFYRENMGQVIKVDLEKYGVRRERISYEELQKSFRNAVLDYRPGLIGFSCLEMTYDQGLGLANSIKDFPIPKIFGGIYPTFAPRIVLRELVVDMICEGEGEEMFPELASALESGRDIKGILNLTVKQNGKIYRSGKQIKLEDLPTGDKIYGENTGLRRPLTDMATTLLAPDFSIYNSKRFWKKMGGVAVRAISMELSRGCPFSCTFCCTPMQRYQHNKGRERFSKYSGVELKVLKKTDPHHREKPLDKFISEVKDAQDNYSINFIYFTDESFLSMSPKRFNGFIEKYREIGLPFFIETRAETVRKEYAKKLESVGCGGIAIGIESGSLRIRKQLLNRLMNDEVIVEAFKEFEETKIRISANNIIGFPGETREDIMQTIEINRQINPDSVVVNAFRPYSGTELRKLCIENGLIPPEERAEDNRTYSSFDNGVLSGEEIEGIRRVFNLYVKFPKERWNEIRMAESDERLRKILNEEFLDRDLLHRRKTI